jgi:hypothetical protein
MTEKTKFVGKFVRLVGGHSSVHLMKEKTRRPRMRRRRRRRRPCHRGVRVFKGILGAMLRAWVAMPPWTWRRVSH